MYATDDVGRSGLACDKGLVAWCGKASTVSSLSITDN